MQESRQVTQIMAEAYAGDSVAKEAFFSLVRSRLEKIIHNIRGRLPGACDLYSSEDDLNEVWTRIVEEKIRTEPGFKNRNQFFNAFYKGALNLLIDRLRNGGRRGQLLQQFAAEREKRDPTSPSAGAMRIETKERVLSAISHLSEQERVLFGHHYLAGLSQTEAFRQMGLPESTGRDVLNRMHAKVGALLRKG